MAGQGPSRRELLQAMAVAAAASSFSGFSRWNFALADSMDHHAGEPVNPLHTRPIYTPQFFTPLEYKIIDELSDLILPPVAAESAADARSVHSARQPGARDVGVAEFIDFTVSSDPALQPPFRDGLRWLNQAAAPGHSFIDISRKQQCAILDRLAFVKQHRENEKAGQQFFALARRYTVMGFYTTREGLESLKFPGLSFYSTSPGCTHPDNPEHAGLS